MHDYGYDLLVFSFDEEGYTQPGELRLQLKASDSIKVLQGDTIVVRVQRSNLVHWLRERMPVILIAFDVSNDQAYWLDVKEYFRTLEGFNVFAQAASLSIRIPMENNCNPDAVRSWIARKNLEFEGR